MRYENMKEFFVLSQSQNYLNAAEELFISQSTLSKHIKEMEYELGVKLFNRSTRKVQLTEFGEILLPYAKRSIDLHREYTAALSKHLYEENNTITLGVLSSWREQDITPFTSDFQIKNNKIKINVIPDDSEKLFHLLDSNMCDFIFAREEAPKIDDQYQRISLFTDDMKVCLPKKHPLAHLTSIHLNQIKNESLLLSEKYTLSYKIGTTACRMEGFEPKILFGGFQVQMLKYLQNDLGIALIFGSRFLDPLQKDFVTIPISPPISSYINIIYKNNELNDIKLHYLDFIKDFTSKK